ncbi:MAG: hypothetical protein CVU06_12190 [Bacteroidetes bacterium HGW-Bacteroidetes-22]|nr:MAG: hypothetical protein CVU06_12190 [Bacteroidetes bacterium HGW-Bacteroidetes-22]
MKTMKRILSALLFVLILSLSFSCSDNCSNEAPRARILNNGTNKASVQIKTTGGNTININNIDPGTASSYQSYAAGLVTFTITVSDVDYVKVVAVSNCFEYDIAIDANNNITVLPIDRNE